MQAYTLDLAVLMLDSNNAAATYNVYSCLPCSLAQLLYQRLPAPLDIVDRMLERELQSTDKDLGTDQIKCGSIHNNACSRSHELTNQRTPDGTLQPLLHADVGQAFCLQSWQRA